MSRYAPSWGVVLGITDLFGFLGFLCIQSPPDLVLDWSMAINAFIQIKKHAAGRRDRTQTGK
ncbi:hypothetical protein KL86SPO_31228 [uncultured Sporomusa sp.]|uniref:Uncharacterized protein n=1 Tax=uncultured Sporomusa sp. TaxID=307249 RepID=A0A212LUH9_9FIRM|nr:hypothetical protein KL86SPO_31228 [uncultured Sporomusa sp.]